MILIKKIVHFSQSYIHIYYSVHKEKWYLAAPREVADLGLEFPFHSDFAVFTNVLIGNLLADFIMFNLSDLVFEETGLPKREGRGIHHVTRRADGFPCLNCCQLDSETV